MGLGVPVGGVLPSPPSPLAPVSPLESVGAAVGLSDPVAVGVGVVVVGGDVVVGVAVGDEVVGVVVGVGDDVDGVGVGVKDTVGEGVGLAAAGVAEHDAVGVGDAGGDEARSSAVCEAGEAAVAAASAFVVENSTLVQYSVRDGGQFAEGAGLADGAPLDVVPPRPGTAT